MSRSPSLFGRNLRAMREYRNFSVYELSRASGVPMNTIYNLESGGYQQPGWHSAVKLAKALGVSLDYFAREDANDSARMAAGHDTVATLAHVLPNAAVSSFCHETPHTPGEV